MSRIPGWTEDELAAWKAEWPESDPPPLECSEHVDRRPTICRLIDDGAPRECSEWLPYASERDYVAYVQQWDEGTDSHYLHVYTAMIWDAQKVFPICLKIDGGVPL